MSRPFADARLQTRTLVTVLTIVVVAAFVRLGLWQLHRAEEKRTLLTQYEQGQQSTVELTANNAQTLTRYQRVRARGHYLTARQILLDNMPSQAGRAGYRVVTPFELEDGAWMLVDRGWISPGKTRTEIPDVPVAEDVREVSGQFDQLPRAGIDLAPADTDSAGSFPRVLSFPQPATVEKVLGHPVLPGLVLLDPTLPDGFERHWQARLPFGPGRHIAYAVQWFALAAAAVTLYLVLTFRRKPSSND